MNHLRGLGLISLLDTLPDPLTLERNVNAPVLSSLINRDLFSPPFVMGWFLGHLQTILCKASITEPEGIKPQVAFSLSIDLKRSPFVE